MARPYRRAATDWVRGDTFGRQHAEVVSDGQWRYFPDPAEPGPTP